MQDFREFRKRPFHSHLGWKKGCKSEWPFGYQCLPSFREHAAAVGYLPFTVLKLNMLRALMIEEIRLQSGTYRLRYWNRYKRFINRNIKRLQSGTYRLRYWNHLLQKNSKNHICCSRVLTVYGIETSYQQPSLQYQTAAVGYLPFTVLKQDWRKPSPWSYRGCSRVLTVYGIETKV